jgi:hypothetical protein
MVLQYQRRPCNHDHHQRFRSRASSTPAVVEEVTINRCGSSLSNAKTKCSRCPKGIDSECAAGETCHAGLPDCTSGRGTPSPVLPPASPTPSGGGDGPPGTTYATLNNAQLTNARTIIKVGKDHKVPEYGWVIALAAATQVRSSLTRHRASLLRCANALEHVA